MPNNQGEHFLPERLFADTDSSYWTATVNYGDGSDSQRLALRSDKTFSLLHKYVNNGVYTVTVTVKDNKGAVGTDTVLVTVTAAGVNVAPVVNAGSDATITKGRPSPRAVLSQIRIPTTGLQLLIMVMDPIASGWHSNLTRHSVSVTNM